MSSSESGDQSVCQKKVEGSLEVAAISRVNESFAAVKVALYDCKAVITGRCPGPGSTSLCFLSVNWA